MRFSDKNIVITGGAGGIGIAASRHFILQGVKNLAILDIVNENQTVIQLKKEFSNINIVYIKMDVTQKQEVSDAFQLIQNDFKFIDIVICVAGILWEKDIQQTLNVNFIGVAYTTLTAMDMMSLEKGGRGGIIAPIASISGLGPFFTLPIYGASKHAVIGFMSSLADEYYYKKYGIKFITIIPGLTDTPILENMEQRVLFNELGKLLAEQLNGLAKNSANDIGKLITDILAIGENGSIWLADENTIKETKMLKQS